MTTSGEKRYEIQAGDKIVRFTITVYFREGVAVTTFMPEGWTPENINMPTSLDFAREIAGHLGLDMEHIHEAIIEVLQADEDTNIAAALTEGLHDLQAAQVHAVEELWQRVHQDDIN
jgi:hypothetical protein